VHARMPAQGAYTRPQRSPSAFADEFEDDDQEELGGKEEPTVYESPWAACVVRGLGQACFVLVGVIGFFVLVASQPISGLSNMPHYADNMLYATVAHHFAEVHAVTYSESPPPPPKF